MDIRFAPISPQLGTLANDAASASSARQTPLQNFTVAPTVPGSLVQQPASTTSPDQVKQALKDINTAMQSLSSNLEFSLDEESDQAIIKVVDSQTGDVIRQIPSKEALEISKALDKVQGLLVRQQA
ncbi:MAG TPA: hypothetical protein DHV59_17665 [Oxalobacteraceae bacterium]|nr:hypothetical protein [Oxalobacteraceae bacterium]